MISHVGILPADVLDALVAKLNSEDESPNLRFLRLPHPRTGVPSLFLPYTNPANQRTSILEVQTVAPPNDRSWFISDGIVVQNGKLLVMTPVDPAFLLIPILEVTLQSEGQLGNFRTAEDIFEDAVDKLMLSPPQEPSPKDPSSHLSKEDLLHFTSLDCTQKAMARVCETKDVTPEIKVYRYTREKVVETLKAKVSRLNSPTIFEGSRTLVRALAKDGLMEDGKSDLLEVGRLRAACDLVSQYVPDNIHKLLLASYDFTSLDAHMKVLHEEAAALAAADMNRMEIKESKSSVAEKAGGKKRKAASTGVEKLKKANTKGMAKLSTFFQAKTA